VKTVRRFWGYRPVKEMKSKKGIFITFEGIDGSGKTTQIKLLDDFIASLGFETLLTREPGGTKIGDMIRDILLDPENKIASARTETFLFQASRAELVSEVIIPGLDSGKVVICDRFFDSTVAYQGFARGLEEKEIRRMSLWATSGLEPDLTFLLSLDVTDGEMRIDANKKGRDRIEFEKKEFKEKIRKGYLNIARKFPSRFVIIDAALPVQGIFEIIKDSTLKLLVERGWIKNAF